MFKRFVRVGLFAGALALCNSIGADAQFAGQFLPGQGPLGTGGSGYPPGATPQMAAASGTTGVVNPALNAIPGQFEYLCGFQVSSAGGTASSGPVVVTGILNGPLTFQLPVNASGVPVNFSQAFYPCPIGSALGQGIRVSTAANATATAVNVQLWGYSQ